MSNPNSTRTIVASDPVIRTFAKVAAAKACECSNRTTSRVRVTSMLRRLLQPIWVLLAVIFLIEAWLWDHLEPIVAWVVAKIPLQSFKHWLAERVDTLSPAMTLIVFIVPVIPLFPLKLIGFWLLAHEYWLSAAMTIIFAKLVGVGVT